MSNHKKLACSKLTPFSEQWCKEKKAEILKALPAFFEDMSKLKLDGYLAVAKFREKPLSFHCLKDQAGIYMITNKINKKIYIGRSKNLRARLYNYFYVSRLEDKKSSRIHRALLKYEHINFSLTILELVNSNKDSVLKDREDFFIKVFKPQYNIARSSFNIDSPLKENSRSFKRSFILPFKINNLLDKALDSSYLDWHLISFGFIKTKGFYFFIFATPKSFIRANSLGWFEGDITSKKGYEVTKRTKESKKKEFMSTKNILNAYKLIDKEKLASFYPKERSDFVEKQFKAKAKALKKLIP